LESIRSWATEGKNYNIFPDDSGFFQRAHLFGTQSSKKSKKFAEDNVEMDSDSESPKKEKKDKKDKKKKKKKDKRKMSDE